jgi:hypothetical protein
LTWQCAVTTGEHAAIALPDANASAGTAAVAEKKANNPQQAKCQCPLLKKVKLYCPLEVTQEDLLCDSCRETCKPMTKKGK